MLPEPDQLLGRDAELARLKASFAALQAGRGSLALIAGEPGIGKTRLAEELVAHAREQGALVAWGAAWDGGGAPAYWPWIQALRGLRAELPEPSEALKRDLGPLWDDQAQGGDSNPEAQNFRRFDALRALLGAATSRAPLVLVLDDLHAADRATLMALHFVSRNLRALRVMVVGTHRDSDARLRPEIGSLLERIAREGATLLLGRLERSAVASLMAELDPQAPGLVDQVYRSSGGNPFFAKELLRLIKSGAGAKTIPDGARALVAERLGQFDERTRSVLEAASVLGRETSLNVLSSLCQSSRHELAELLRVPRLAGVVQDTGADGIVFSHPLFRECLYDGQSARARAQLHLAAAHVLSRLAPSSAGEEESLARHLLLALPEGDATLAIARARSAAAGCRRALAFDRAVDLLEGALQALGASHDSLRFDLELELAEALVLVGQGERGREICAGAAERARGLGDANRLAQAALASGAQIRIGVTDPVQIALLDEALTALGSGEPALRAKVMARLAAARHPAPVLEGPMAMAREAIALARTTGDAEALLHSLHMGGSALSSYAPPEERQKVSRELVTLALGRRELVVAQRGYQRLAIDAAELGDAEALEEAVRAEERLGLVLGHARFRWESALLASFSALIEGRWADSEAAIARASALVAELEDPAADFTLRIHRSGAFRARMRFGADEVALMRSLMSTPQGELMARIFEASNSARAGELAHARSLLAALLPSIPEPVLRLPFVLTWVAECAARLGDAAASERFLPRLEALPFPAHTWGRTGYIFEGFTADVIGTARAVLGQWNEAAEALESAVEGAEQLRARPSLVESRITLAHVLQRRNQPGDRARAEQLLELAESDAVELDMTASLRRLREIRHGQQPAAPQASGGLSIDLVRDGEIWSISSQGKTARLKHSRALELLKHLLDHPGREFHVLELGAAGEGDAVIDLGDPGELFDQEAKGAYLRRLEELRGELAEAERWNDPARKARVQAELEFLEDELGRGSAAGGKLRRSAGAAERARVNVHKRLRGAIKRIMSLLPELGQHLEVSIRTGLFVSYRPMD